MISPQLFLFGLATALGLLFWWAFVHLPRERWQILAAVPLRRLGQGRWQGANLTAYGLLYSGAATFAAAVFLLLVAAAGASRATALAVGGGVLVAGMAGAKLVARLVEGKRHTFTVAGGAAVGLLVAPLAAAVADRGGRPGGGGGAAPALAALAVAYLLGEGVGRLACISFGCCYGKPLAEAGALSRWLFGRIAFTFRGPTKKIAYASRLEGVGVVPIQAVTASLYALGGLVAMGLFLAGRFAAAFLVAVAGGLVWRLVSETLRADYRGGGRRVSAYQVMTFGALLFAGFVATRLPAPGAAAVDLGRGLAALWDPAIILLLQGLWAALFLWTGWSRVTGSRLSFFVHRSRI
jgi:hypothetical protein